MCGASFGTAPIPCVISCAAISARVSSLLAWLTRLQVDDRVRERDIVHAALPADAELGADVRRAVEVDEIALVGALEPGCAKRVGDSLVGRHAGWDPGE